MAREKLFYWCHNTVGQRFESGIQRVVRRLAEALATIGVDVVPVGWDDRTRQVKVLGQRPGASDIDALLAGGDDPPRLLVPELTMDLVAGGVDPIQLGRAYGMATFAIVHDLIPLKLRTHYSDEVVRGFERYYASLAPADGVITTTHYVARDLRHHLDTHGLAIPVVTVVPLPAQFADTDRVADRRAPRRIGDPLRLVAVSTWEPRKNQERLLRSLAKAQAATDVAISLRLAGRHGLFPDYDRQVIAAATKAADVTLCGRMTDQAIATMIRDADASVYPSWEEGFGLPIGESLWLGTPCLCHYGSSMAEIAPGGGAMMVDVTDEDALAAALVALASEPDVLQGLSDELAARPLTRWTDFAQGVVRALERVKA